MMAMTNDRDATREQIAEEAAEWFVLNRGGLDDAQKVQFFDWLRRSAVHVEEYLGIAQVTGDLIEAVARRTEMDPQIEQARAADEAVVQPIRPQIRTAPTASRPRTWWYAAAAAALAVIAFGTTFWSDLRPRAPVSAQVIPAHFSTRHGEQLTQPLSDGSVLYLNTDTAVLVRYEHGTRLVDVEHGQVVFEVAHDPTRPFHVLAGSAEVIAVGTRFDVYLQGQSTLVTVVEGRVTVGPTPAFGGSATGSRTRKPMPVAAGQMVRVVQGQLPEAPSPVDPGRTTAWQQRQISIEAVPLAEVAAEFNRYSSTPVEIETPSLRGLAVSGVFAVDDTESFVAFLRNLDGVSVEVTADRIRVFKH
jgi:transmembrane sensor